MTILYGSNTADSTLSSACDLANSSGGVETSIATSVPGGNLFNFFEVASQGAASAQDYTAYQSPTGNGWVFQPGSGFFAADNWSASIALKGNSAITCTLRLRFYQWTGPAAYTAIGSIDLTGQTLTTSRAVYTFAATAMPTVTFAQGDLLYVDLWVDDTGGDGGDTVTVYVGNSPTVGVANDMQITTAAFTQTGPGDPFYGSSVADGTLTTACDMASTTGGTETSVVTSVPAGSANNFFEAWSQGNAAQTDFTAYQNPTGHGWLYRPGAGTFAAGNWSATIALKASGALTCTLRLRLYKYNGSVYTSIGFIDLAGQTLTTSRAVYTFAVTAMAAVTFNSTDMLYFDLWVDDTGGDGGDVVTVYLSSSASVGVANDMQVVPSVFTPVVSTRLSVPLPKWVERGITSTFRLVTSPVNVPRYVARGFMSTLANYAPNITTRLRLGLPLDTGLRLRLQAAASTALDIATRLRLGLPRDLALRLRLGLSRDVAARLRLGKPQDIAARVRLALSRNSAARLRLGFPRDTATRLRLALPRDLSTRLRVALAKDLAARVRLALTRDISLRFRVGLPRDVTLRLRVGLPRDVASRVRLQQTALRDVVTHVRLALARDVATRLRLALPRDTSLRLRLQTANTGVKDLALRLRLALSRDSAARLRLGLAKDIIVRLRLGLPRDIATRMRLGKPFDVAVRTRLAFARDLQTRVRLGLPRDTALRLRLQLLGAATLRDIALRVRLQQTMLRDVSLRLRLGLAKDIRARIRLALARDAATRVRLALTRDIVGRLRLGKAQDVSSRLRVGKPQDVPTRTRLALTRDLVTRLRVGKPADVRVRLRVGKPNDLVTRMRLAKASDALLRMRLATTRDTALRLRLKTLLTTVSSDAALRLRLYDNSVTFSLLIARDGTGTLVTRDGTGTLPTRDGTGSLVTR